MQSVGHLGSAAAAELVFVVVVLVWLEQYVRISVGPVKTESRIVKRDLNPEWNQVFAIGRDKIQGGALELSVWDAVIYFINHP